MIGPTTERFKEENGKKKFTDTVMKADGKTSLQDYEYEKAWENLKASEWAEMYMQNGYIVDPMPTLKYTKEENRKIQKINSQLNMAVKEMNQKWILGAVDFNKTYDEFLNRLNEIGLKEAIDINQKAYDRFINSSN